MRASEYAAAVSAELRDTLAALDDAQVDALAQMVVDAKRVFLSGAGRSLLMAKCCAMRLMQLGLTAFVVGETTTPAITAADLLIAVSGSGETAGIVCMAQKARSAGARLALITIVPDSSAGRLADAVVRIDASSTKVASAQARSSVQLGGGLFELSALLVLEALVMQVAEKRGIEEPNVLLMRNHANLE